MSWNRGGWSPLGNHSVGRSSLKRETLLVESSFARSALNVVILCWFVLGICAQACYGEEVAVGTLSAPQ